MKRWIIALFFFTVLLAIWEALVRTRIWSPVLAPPPHDVFRYFVEAMRDGTLVDASASTLKRLLVGYACGLVFGIPLGLVNAQSKTAQDTLGLLALGLQTLPSVCWAPIAIQWFGQTEGAMFFIVVMGSVWSILLATDSGVRNVPPIYVRAAQTMGSRGLHTWLKVIFPAALPFIVSGMKQGWAFSWRSLMAAEIYITIISGAGLGNILHDQRELLRMDGVIGIMILIMVIGLLADKILFAPLERFMHKRWGTGK